MCAHHDTMATFVRLRAADVPPTGSSSHSPSPCANLPADAAMIIEPLRTVMPASRFRATRPEHREIKRSCPRSRVGSSCCMIHDLKIRRSKVIADERDWLIERLRAHDELLRGPGQACMTNVYPRGVKAWFLRARRGSVRGTHGTQTPLWRDALRRFVAGHNGLANRVRIAGLGGAGYRMP